jgi:membrane peptidoglycan carboxypeptidase
MLIAVIRYDNTYSSSMLTSFFNRTVLGHDLSKLRTKGHYPVRGLLGPFEIGLTASSLINIYALPSYTIAAILFHEDQNFFIHHGFHWAEIRRRVFDYMTAKGVRGSGSSISQQTARQINLIPYSSLSQKLKEAFLTIELEQKFTKEEILALYLSTVFLGGAEVVGITSASERYFNKAPSELTLHESIFLAQLPEGPRFKESTLLQPNWQKYFNLVRAHTKFRDLLLYYYYTFGIDAAADLKQISASEIIAALKKSSCIDKSIVDPHTFTALDQRAALEVLEMKRLIDRLAERRSTILGLPS